VPSFEDLQKDLCRQYGIDLDKHTLEGSVNELASSLFPPVAAKTGRTEEELRKSLKSVHLDHRPLIDGHATSQDNWRTFEISVSEGLLIFHHKMVKLFVSRVSVVGNGQKMVEETTISHEETLSIAKRLIAAFWAGNFFETPGLSLASLTKSQIFLSSILLTYSESFVIAHEFGHMILQAFPDSTRRERMILMGVEDSMVRPALKKFPCADEPEALRNWMEELAADYVGINLCARLQDSAIQKTMIQAAGMISLMMCDILEKCRAKVGGGDWQDLTHPPSELRVEVLQSLLDWPAGMEFGDVFHKFSEYIIAGI